MAPQKKFMGMAVIGTGLLAGIAAAVLWPHPAAQVQLATGTYLSPSRAVPNFSLIDQRGRTFGNADLQGRWSLLLFGYTQCADFCPATLATLAAMQKRLKASGAPLRPRVIFLSVDAKRDTPARLAAYVPYFDPEFIGLTAADQSTVEVLARQLGVAVLLRPALDGAYRVEHTGAIFVLDPKGRVTAILTGPFTVQSLQDDFERIAAARA